VCAHDFGDQGVSPQQTKFAANPGRVAAPLLFVVGSLEEDGAEIAVAEAMDSELAVFGATPARSSNRQRGTNFWMRFAVSTSPV
jgi:hypothetical protein